MGILKTNFISYLADSFVCSQQPVFHFADYCLVNVFDGRLSRLLLNQVAKVVG